MVIGAETADGTDTGGLDNVMLYPEPTTLVLLLVGATVAARRRP
jgi:hypothetical protein